MDLEKKKYINKIKSLAREKNAVIFAHYYTRPEIQEIADFIGDSLALAQQATRVQADILVMCGVHFMGETIRKSSSLNPLQVVRWPTVARPKTWPFSKHSIPITWWSVMSIRPPKLRH